jgi:hypothetical protein
MNRRQKGIEHVRSRTTPNAGRFEVRATADSHFGWIRTRLSVEHTMMSWQRTAVALIGFGFAIVQYLNHLQQTPGARLGYLPTAPEYLGLALISCSVLALVISDLAAPVGPSLSVGRPVHANRGRYQGGKANAGDGGRHPPHRRWPFRLLCGAVSPRVAR